MQYGIWNQILKKKNNVIGKLGEFLGELLQLMILHHVNSLVLITALRLQKMLILLTLGKAGVRHIRELLYYVCNFYLSPKLVQIKC